MHALNIQLLKMLAVFEKLFSFNYLKIFLGYKIVIFYKNFITSMLREKSQCQLNFSYNITWQMQNLADDQDEDFECLG